MRDKLAVQRAKGEMHKKHDEIDDNRSAGKTLKEIADLLKLSFQDIPGADRKGNGPDGKPVMTSAADLNKIVSEVFAPDANALDQGIELPSGAVAWLNVTGTDAPKQKTFDEVKAEVKEYFMGAERVRLVTELAVKLTERLNAGEAVSALEAAAGGKAEKTEPVTRITLPQGLSDAALAQAFVIGKGKAAHAESSDRGSRIVFKVAEIAPAAAPTKEQLEKIASQVQGDFTSQVLNEYAESLKKQYSASVNELELKRAFGTSDQ